MGKLRVSPVCRTQTAPGCANNIGSSWAEERLDTHQRNGCSMWSRDNIETSCIEITKEYNSVEIEWAYFLLHRFWNSQLSHSEVSMTSHGRVMSMISRGRIVSMLSHGVESMVNKP